MGGFKVLFMVDMGEVKERQLEGIENSHGASNVLYGLSIEKWDNLVVAVSIYILIGGIQSLFIHSVWLIIDLVPFVIGYGLLGSKEFVYGCKLCYNV